jgi:hypothetical protein
MRNIYRDLAADDWDSMTLWLRRELYPEIAVSKTSVRLPPTTSVSAPSSL